MLRRSGQQKIPGSYSNTIAPCRLHELTLNQLIHTVSDSDDSPGTEINMLDYQQIPSPLLLE